jgi:hypothetical protein
MSHDLYADWACLEIARLIRENPEHYFQNPAGDIAAFATQEGGRSWPICDGVISIALGNSSYNIALEMKRVNEGLHGVLTALGQSHAYIHKGFNASIIVIPDRYISHANPGAYIQEVLNLVSAGQPILVFSYQEPDTSSPRPFFQKLTCHRSFLIDTYNIQVPNAVIRRTETQWGHVREGSTDPHAFYIYLQTAKKYSLDEEIDIHVQIPMALSQALSRINNFNGDALKYLSSSPGDTYHDRIWRKFWFENILHTESIPIFSQNSNYEPLDISTKIYQPNGSFKKFFVGRTDSIKNKLCSKLSNQEISLDNAWVEYAKNINKRAHSYREDVDSGLVAFGLLEFDGKPSELGYKFVDAVERYQTWNSSIPKLILGYSLLANANFLSFLHYTYRLTEEEMSNNNFSFYENNRFNSREYLNWLRDKLANDLCVMRTVNLRGGQTRIPFQAELAILRQYGFVKGFRLGSGLEINWPLIHETLDSFPKI